MVLSSDRSFSKRLVKLPMSAMRNRRDIPVDMTRGIEVFRERASSLVERLVRRSNRQRRPRLIYHYTNNAGLMGIVEKGELWLTNAAFLNDPRELEHGVEPALRRIEAASREGRQELAWFVEPLGRSLRENLSEIAHCFICSFSREHDDLGQWRGYGDTGKGYAIGFEAKTLEAAFNARPGGHSQSFPLEYSEIALRRIQAEIAALVLPLVAAPRGRRLPNRVIGRYMGRLAAALAENVILAAILFKHAAYENEREIRFLEIHAIDGVADVRHRSRGYKRVPFTVFDWRRAAPKALKKIIIGPGGDLDRCRQFAEECLRAGGFRIRDGMIGKSAIPYRG
jgi:hypothetical protein